LKLFGWWCLAVASVEHVALLVHLKPFGSYTWTSMLLCFTVVAEYVALLEQQPFNLYLLLPNRAKLLELEAF
jgi:predicted transcriptional regulator of viral defense system